MPKEENIHHLTIREARLEDAEAMRAIYAPYVEHTAVTFEYETPTIEEFRRRMETVQARYPGVVVEDDGCLVGYAYASPFKERDAYQWAVETSIYLDITMRRKGVGSLLYEQLEEALRRQGILNMNACISYIEPEDEYLSLDSVRFHERMGYTLVAHFHQCGKKFGRWYDMVWMEKLIGEHK